MVPKPLVKFMQQLFEATNQKTITWYAGDHNAFFCTHKGITLHISFYFDGDRGESSISFVIEDAANPASFSVYDYEDEYTFMRNLHDAVQVNATKIDEKLKNFFD